MVVTDALPIVLGIAVGMAVLHLCVYYANFTLHCTCLCMCVFATVFDATQFFIAAVILLGMLEKTFLVSEYGIVNTKGMSCKWEGERE